MRSDIISINRIGTGKSLVVPIILKQRQSTKERQQEMTNYKQQAIVDPHQAIRRYFEGNAEERDWLRNFIASSTRSVESILKILEWSIKPDLIEPYDAAIALLSKFGDVLLRANDEFLEHSSRIETSGCVEEKWEILIRSIAFAEHISFERRLYAITEAIPNQQSRLIKSAIIDALVSMQDDIGEGLIGVYLAYYSSEAEPDEVVRQLARNTAIML